jgi:hypothetical protein
MILGVWSAKPELNRSTLALKGGLRILRGFCYTLLFAVAQELVLVSV